MSVAASVANITLNQLDPTANCSNLALWLYVFENELNLQSPNPRKYKYDNDSYDNSTVDDGPSEYFEDFWTNGTSPECINFWRLCLRFQYLSAIKYRQPGFGRDSGASFPFSQCGMEDHADLSARS